MIKFPLFEDINLLVVKQPNHGPEMEKFYRDLKTAFDSLISLSIDDVFQVFDHEQIQQMTIEQLERFTHVISDTIDIPHYEQITKDLMIPIVSKRWLQALVKNKHSLTLRPYSSDPRHIFKDFSISALDLPAEDDYELIKVGVTVFGGSYLTDLKKCQTHLITTNLDSDGVRIASAFSKNNVSGIHIHIVKPSWLIDSIKAGRVLPEEEYSVGEDNDQLTINKISNYYQPNFNFQLSKTLKISELMTSSLEWIFASRKEQSDHETIVISRYHDHEIEPHQQRTFDFLFDLIFEKSDKINNSLLHYPIPASKNEDLTKLVVATTNYTGDARLYIEELIRRMGGKFTKNLNQMNTQLVAAKKVGKKYDFSKKKKIDVVSHMWVEDCFTNWKKMDVQNYRDLPRSNDNVRRIGDIEFDGFSKVNGGSSGKDNETTSEKQLKTSNIDNENIQNTTPIVAEHTKKVEEVIIQPEEPTEIPNSLPDSATTAVKTMKPIPAKRGRRKQEKVADNEVIDTSIQKDVPDNKVWEIPDDQIIENSTENEEKKPVEKPKKKHQTEDSLPIPESKKLKPTKAKLRRNEVKVTEVEHDTKASDIEVIAEPVVKKTVSNTKPYNITAIVTGFDGTLSPGDKRELKKVGISIIENANKNLNCIIAPSLLRTQKFLTSLSFDPEYFIEPIFLNDVLGTLDSTKTVAEFEAIAPKLEKYDIWNGIDYEKDIKPKNIFHESITKFEAMKLMKKSKSGLFQGYSFNLSSGLAGGFDTLKMILKSFGCKSFSNFKENSKTLIVNQEKKVNGFENTAILISNENEKKLHDHFIARCVDMEVNYVILKWDVIVMAIFESEIKFDNLIHSSFN